MDFWNEINPLTILKQKNRDLLGDVFFYIYFIFLLFISYNLLNILIDKFARSNDSKTIYNRRRIARYSFAIIATLGALPIFYSRIDYLPTILALTGAGFVISMKDVTLNFIGWILIHSKSGFSIGDRIEIETAKGEVVNIGIMRFTLLEVSKSHESDQSTNRLIHIPNHQTLIHKFFVISKDLNYIWDEIYIYLEIYSDWKKAIHIAEKILYTIYKEANIEEFIEENIKEISKDYLLKIGKTTPIVYTSIENGKILLSLRYLTKFHERRMNRDKIFKQILIHYSKDKKIRLFNLQKENKE